MKIRVRRPKECDLLKGLDKTNLVLVEVPVNGERTRFNAHRWKRPNQALELTKQVIQGKANKKGNVQFTSKRTGDSASDKEVIKNYIRDKKNEKVTLEEYISKNYKVKITEKDSDVIINRITGKDTKPYNKVGPKTFEKAIELAKKTLSASIAWRVTAHKAKEYKNTRNFVSKGGSTFAITNDGDIISVCKNENDTIKGKDILKEAVKQGGIKLDSFCGNHVFYQKCGFEAVSWCDWDDEFAPPDWKEDYPRENIIFYRYTGKVPDKIESPESFFKRVKKSKDYDAAKDVRESLLREN